MNFKLFFGGSVFIVVKGWVKKQRDSELVIVFSQRKVRIWINEIVFDILSLQN